MGARGPTDILDHVLSQWARERPELDGDGLAVVGRVLVLAKLLDRSVGHALKPLGLSLWAFDMLATLRRQGAPFRMTPTELGRSTMLTSGAITNRIDRLAERGWVRREPDPHDRRGVYVMLTEAGRELADRAVEVRLKEAEGAVQVLPEPDRTALREGLARWLKTLAPFEPTAALPVTSLETEGSSAETRSR